jgi:cyclophilin family peptidyl-prolyl cis-trans isomerase
VVDQSGRQRLSHRRHDHDAVGDHDRRPERTDHHHDAVAQHDRARGTLTGATPCPAADGSSPRTVAFAQAPPSCIDKTKTYTATVTTNKGAYTIALDAAAAPLTVNNFVVLARYHYFDSTICHRAIPQFAVQCGDPSGTGSGGPGYTFADELPAAGSYKVGSIAMANSGPDTNGSQFFIITGANGARWPRTTRCSVRSPTDSTRRSRPSTLLATPTLLPTACRRSSRS